MSNNIGLELLGKYKHDPFTLYGGYIYARLMNPSDDALGGFQTIAQGISVPGGFFSKGVFINKCYDELNLRNPEIVYEVHRQYVRAGAEILETNTYGANRVKLHSFGIEDELREIKQELELTARLERLSKTATGRGGQLSAPETEIKPAATGAVMPISPLARVR